MKILMLLDNGFFNDNRVLREGSALADVGFDVTLLAVEKHDKPKYETVKGIKIERVISPRIYNIKDQKYKNNLVDQVLKYEFDVLHCHDQEMLNIGAKVKQKKHETFLVYDSHELFHAWPLNLSNYGNKLIAIKSLIVRKLQIRREKQNIKFADEIITVNQSLANDISSHFKVNIPTIVRNIPELSQTVNSVNIRAEYGISSNKKILVFIGANVYLNTLNMEQVFEEIANDNSIVLLIIAINNQNRKNVEKYVSNKGYKNIIFHDDILVNQIPDYLSGCDIGLVPTWNKKDLSYWYALDNKLFEYIQAGIPILTTQQPEYRLITNKYDVGIAVNPDKKGAYLNGLKSIYSRIDFYKENVKNAAKELCWKNEKNQLLSLYKNITK